MHKAYPNRITWLIEPKRYHQNFTRTCPLLLNEWKFGQLQKKYTQIWHVVDFSTQSLTRCNFLNSKYDALNFFKFKICPVKKISIQNQAFWKNTKMQNMLFSRTEKNQNVIFLDANIFQNLTCRKISNSKSNALYFFSIQKLTRCKNLNSKSDALWKLYFEIWQVSKLFPRNLIFILFFRFWLNDDIFCQSYYQLILKRRIEEL